MRDWRAEIYKQDLQSGIGVSNLADEMADEIERLLDALRKLAIAQIHRMAQGGGTMHMGYCCKLCDGETTDAQAPESIEHEDDCLLGDRK